MFINSHVRTDISSHVWWFWVAPKKTDFSQMLNGFSNYSFPFLCSYLLPHLLPHKPAVDLHGFRQQTNNTLQRLIKMSFVPAGFWERFIARMLISLKEMDLQVVPLPSSAVTELFQNIFWLELLCVCSHLNRKETLTIRAASTLHCLPLLEVSRRTAAVPSESGGARLSTGRRGCWSPLREGTWGLCTLKKDKMRN